MKGKFIQTLGLILAVGGLAFVAWNAFQPADSILFNGKDPLRSRIVEYRGQQFDVVWVDPGKYEVRLFWKNAAGEPYASFGALKEELALEGRQLRFATNAGIFSEDLTPGGLHVENGSELKSLNLKDGGGNFHMKPNGVFLLGNEGAGVVESETFHQKHLSAEVATQSGPMLVIDGKLHPSFNEGSDNKFIRNGVGVDRNGTICFAISQERVNFYDFATLFRDQLGCPDALYLDGSISEFYIPELNRENLDGNFCGILAVFE